MHGENKIVSASITLFAACMEVFILDSLGSGV